MMILQSRLALLAGFAVVALSSFAQHSSAQALTLVNPSFEQPAVASGNYSLADVPGWAKVGTTDIGVHRLGEFGAPANGDGLQLLFIGNGQNFGSTFQDLTDPLIGSAGVASYTFTIALGTRGGTFTGSINVGLQDTTNGSTPVPTVVPGSALSQAAFQDFSVTLAATNVAVGDTLRVYVDKGAGNSLIVLDNARLVANPATSVPEPATWALLLGGLGLLAAVRRTRTA